METDWSCINERIETFFNTNYCPNCKSKDRSYDFEAGGEIYVICMACGYSFTLSWQLTEKKSFSRTDETEDFTIEIQIKKEVLVDKPFAAFRYELIDCDAIIGSLPNESSYNTFVRDIAEMRDKGEKFIYAKVSRYIDGKIQVIDIVNGESNGCNKVQGMGRILLLPHNRN